MDDMLHIHLKEPDLKVNLERNTFEMVNRVHAEAINMQEDAIVQACIRTAQRFGITDLFLIDEQFVKDALIEKGMRDGIVRCKDCRHRGDTYLCPMRHIVYPVEGAGYCEDNTTDNGYCHYGEKVDKK